MHRSILLCGAVSFLLTLGGCPDFEDPGVHILRGTWLLTGNVVSDEVSDFRLTFDHDGRITQISYVYNGATVTIRDSRFIQNSSDVDGDDVTILVNWLAVNNLSFRGTLSADQGEIVGTTSYSIQIGALEISVPTGPATLTRQ